MSGSLVLFLYAIGLPFLVGMVVSAVVHAVAPKRGTLLTWVVVGALLLVATVLAAHRGKAEAVLVYLVLSALAVSAGRRVARLFGRLRQ